MSYEDMARSHVKELVREAFALDEVIVDRDGDLPFAHGTARYYASVERGGELLRVWSHAVSGLKVKKAVLRELNDINAGLLLARVFAVGETVMVEACAPVECLTPRLTRALCYEVGSTADRLGSMLAAVHGGRVALPDGCDGSYDHEDEV